MKRRTFLPVLLLALVLLYPPGALPAQESEGSEVKIEDFPVAVQCWTYRAFTFRETLDKVRALGLHYLQAYPGQRLSEETGDLAFDHDLSVEQQRLVRGWLRETQITLVAYGVVGLGTTEAEHRRVFDFARRMRIGTIVTEPEAEDYSLIERLVGEYGIRVAVHNHPPPNTYARPETVAERVEGRDRRIGSCADTGHWLRTGVVPVEALRLLEGRIVDVHLKDLDRFDERRAVDVPFGQGVADVRAILAELTRQGYDGYLTIEYENPEQVRTPEPAIRAGLEYLHSIMYWHGYERILSRTARGYNKSGWNHYGPGVFELDREAGVLTGTGGMGLFWYSAKMYRDFVLELDYRCSEPRTNSGIFVRVPKVPASDDYIYHSFEIQIADNGEGIHATGAAYDAEPPSHVPVKPTGEWNHMKITFIGSRLMVEVNGEPVVDWLAEPRGKVADFASEGYIGLQNHDWDTSISFRDIRVKEILNSPPEGFTALFNGRDLTGWKGLVTDPPHRAMMSTEELAVAQAEADENMRAHWSVSDGVLVFDGGGQSLCTARDYGDFEMWVDWKIGPEGDSGIYLRGTPQVQIWDPAQWPVGSGGLYNNQIGVSDPLALADKGIGEWNTFFIRMVGEKVTVRLNGVLVVDEVVMENYWERDKPIYESGQIELQSHSHPLYFRNIYIRELPPRER